MQILDTGTWQVVAPALAVGIWQPLVLALAVAPDGSWLAGASDDGRIRIWDTTTWECLTTLTAEAVHNGISVAPDGRWLAAGERSGEVQIWDTATWQHRTTLKNAVTSVSAVAFTHDGRWLAVSWDESWLIWCYDTATWKEQAPLRVHSETVAIAVTPEGGLLAARLDSPTIRIWDTATWQIKADFSSVRSWGVRQMAIAPDGTWLATGGADGTVRIYDAADGHERATRTTHTGDVNGIAIAQDGSWVAAAVNATIEVWDPRVAAAQPAPDPDFTYVESVSATPDGRRLVSADTHGIVRIWDPATMQPTRTIEFPAHQLSAVALAAAGTWLAAAAGTTVRHVDAASGQVSLFAECDSEVRSVAIAPDGTWLAAGRADGQVQIWDVATKTITATLQGETGTVRLLVIAPGGAWLASAGDGREVQIWDVPTRQAVMSITGRTHDLVIAPDGGWLATASGTEAALFDMTEERPPVILRGHEHQVTGLAFSPDGRWLATVSLDRTVRIWDVTTGRSCALMRVEHLLYTCAWIGDSGLVIGGHGGPELYAFDFLPGHALT